MRVVIVGAGFGGLTTAQKLSKNKDLAVTVIDKHPYQLFHPCCIKLPQVVYQKMTLLIQFVPQFLESLLEEAK
jgi:NADH dehydrogenase FAD-containing subunit